MGLKFIYLLLEDECEWEDIIIYTTEDEAIEASKKYTSSRIEIFKKDENYENSRYKPNYCYIKDGRFYGSRD